MGTDIVRLSQPPALREGRPCPEEDGMARRSAKATLLPIASIFCAALDRKSPDAYALLTTPLSSAYLPSRTQALRTMCESMHLAGGKRVAKESPAI